MISISELESLNASFQGMSVVRKVENLPTVSQDRPKEDAIIADCGEIPEGADDGVPAPVDGDAYEEFPEDLGEEKPADDLLRIVGEIKLLGNTKFKNGDFNGAVDKYSKAIRYLNAIHPSPEDLKELSAEQKKTFYSTKVSCLLNTAMVEYIPSLRSSIGNSRNADPN